MPKDTKITIAAGGMTVETNGDELSRAAKRLPKQLSTAQAERLADHIVGVAMALLNEHRIAIVTEIEKSRAEDIHGVVTAKLALAIEHGAASFTIDPVLEWKREVKFKKEGESDTVDLRQLELFNKIED